MDATQSTPTPEQQAGVSPQTTEQLSADQLEAKKAPVAAESAANQPRRDDGVAAAQTQMAAVTADDVAQTASSDPANPLAATVPTTAADVDVIEPEWVKKAEEVVAKHRDDPRQEETAVENLQREYLRARYNLDVKPGDEKP